MRRVGSILIFLGIVLAILAAVSVFLILYTAQPQPAQVQTAKVVVAYQDIIERSEIAPDQIGAVDWPLSVPTPAGAFERTSDVAGKFAVVHVYPGQSIVDKMVIDKASVSELHSNAALLIEKGSIAIAIPVSLNSNVAEAIQPGDRVDLIATFTAQPVTGTVASGVPVIETQRLVQDVLILQIGPWPDPSIKTEQAKNKVVVTLQIPEQEALVVKYTQVNDADFTLALRAANDHDLFNPTPVSLDYITQKYGFSFRPQGR